MGNQRSMGMAEYETLNKARDEAQEAGMFDVEQKDTTSATVAMMGAGYTIGNITVPQFGLDTITLLSVANVSLLDLSVDDTDNDDSAMRDVAVALYIIANGAESCQMLMGVQQRLRALAKLEGLAKKSPEMFERYMNKIDEIGGGAFAELDRRAFEFLGKIKGATIDDIVDLIAHMTEDFVNVMGLLPDGPDSGKKK
jgi:hypothetical protein